jgi:flavin-dependent dehydrogenase
MDLTRPFDVAIAGAGLAGASLALRLARSGVRVVVVDAARFPREKLCGEFLSPESWRALDELRLTQELDRSGYQPIRRVRLTTTRGRVVEATVVGPEDRPGIGLSRSVLDDLIVREAQKAGAAVLENCRVTGPIVERGRVAGVLGRHPIRGTIELCAKVTVAADGRHSSLVRRTGVVSGLSLFRPRLFGLKRHLRIADAEGQEPPDTVGLHLLPGGYVGTCRIEGTLTNCCGLLPESVARRYRGDLDRLAVDVFCRNPALKRLWMCASAEGEWKTVSGVRVEESSPQLEGIFYAGDCRGTVDPLAGQGMTMALLGAELLAQIVCAALAADGASPALQSAYESAWHHRFGRRIQLCRAFHQILVNPLLVDLGSALKRLSPRLLAACFGWTRDEQPEFRWHRFNTIT